MFSDPQRKRLGLNTVPTVCGIPNPPRQTAHKRKPVKRELPLSNITGRVKKTRDYIAQEKKRISCEQCRWRMEQLRARNSAPARKMRHLIRAKNDALRYLRKK